MKDEVLLRTYYRLETAINSRDIAGMLRIVERYLCNKTEIDIYNEVDEQLHELWKNKAWWLKATQSQPDTASRMHDVLERLDAYFW